MVASIEPEAMAGGLTRAGTDEIISAMRQSPAATVIADERPLPLEFGAALPRIDIVYETWGTLSPERDNVILVCPAFSAHSHAQSNAADPSPGWWEGMIGPGKAFDTERFFMICPALLGGTSGTTGPKSIDPRTGQPYRADFPAVSIRDIVSVHIRLLDHLGIERLYAAAGGSLGAMETVELGVRHPTRVARVIAIAGTDQTRPFTAAIRHIGRRAILSDPAYNGGDYLGEGPNVGLKLARELGTLFYRSRDEFNERFALPPLRTPTREGITFDVQSYLDHQGNKAIGRFDPTSYLTLSLAMDLQDVWRGFPSKDEALAAVEAVFHISAVEEDWLIGIDEQKQLHDALEAAGKESHWYPLSSPVGHDAFLVEIDNMNALITPMLAS